jgi:hypothetical protein
MPSKANSMVTGVVYYSHTSSLMLMALGGSPGPNLTSGIGT